VGLSWNEVSRRYVDKEPEFYFPPSWRARAENVKQGSSDETVTLIQAFPENTISLCLRTYQDLLDDGVAPEQARMILPQTTMTEFIWTGSLYAFARVCKQRLEPHAQSETREVAEKISNHMKVL